MSNKKVYKPSATTIAKRQNQRKEIGEDSTVYLSHALVLGTLPPIEIRDAEQVKGRTKEYFTLCIENRLRASIASYALALGINRMFLWRIRVKEAKVPEECYRTIMWAINIINAQTEDYAQSGKLNPIMSIFLLKSQFGYKDNEDYVDIAQDDTIEDIDTIAKKYKYMPD